MGEDAWITSASRHWFLDRPGPRSEEDVQATAEAILRRMEAATEEAEAAEREGRESAPVRVPDGGERAD